MKKSFILVSLLVMAMVMSACAASTPPATEAMTEEAATPEATEEMTEAPTEAMTAAEHGYSFLKFFPAEALGGAPVLKAFASPLPDISFCPTGGIDLDKARNYLALPNVICVGGSWVMPADAIASRDWKRIEKLAREAAALRKAE